MTRISDEALHTLETAGLLYEASRPGTKEREAAIIALTNAWRSVGPMAAELIAARKVIAALDMHLFARARVAAANTDAALADATAWHAATEDELIPLFKAYHADFPTSPALAGEQALRKADQFGEGKT